MTSFFQNVSAEIVAGIVVAIVVFLVSTRARSFWLKPLILFSTTRLPPWAQSRIVLIADLLVPDWRTFGGEKIRTIEGAQSRLTDFAGHRRAVIILGGAYLDITIGPLSSENLMADEYSGIERIEVQLGGSGPYLGFHLANSFGIKSRLLTRTGRGDPLSKTLNQLISRLTWIKGRRRRNIQQVAGEQSGVSLHLRQSNGNFYTTFTHRGALAGLNWHQHLERIQKYSRRGGLLYVSGFSRTNLSDNLLGNLNRLNPKLLVVFDHGRFQHEENPNALEALVRAFGAGAVDIYVCTFSELRNLSRTIFPASTIMQADNASLVTLAAQSQRFPPTLLVRADDPSANDRAYASHNGTVLSRDLRLSTRPRRTAPLPGEKSAFTAGFIAGLRQSTSKDVTEIISQALDIAVTTWITSCYLTEVSE